MNPINESYVIKISGKSSSEYHYKNKGNWYKVSSRIYLKDRAGEEFANNMERHPALHGLLI